MSDIETTSYKVHRSWGLCYTDFEKDSDGNIYLRKGRIYDPVLGIVTGRMYNWTSKDSGDFAYTAECSYQGRHISVRHERTGTMSYRSLSIWIRKHAIPAMRKHAMEITQ